MAENPLFVEENRHYAMRCKAAILLFILIALVYGHTLYCPWQLDDYANIVHNPKIQMDRINVDSIKNSFYAVPSSSRRLDRPVAYFSFALNWWYGKSHVKGYHVVNIGIHFLTAYFLFCTVLLLFQTPTLKKFDADGAYAIALLSAILWALHPIQIQAVTYIVQRMAQLAALFSIVGIFCYLKARLSIHAIHKSIYFAMCVFAFILGVGSKNNAILLPFSLILLEFVFFRDLKQKAVKKQAAIVFSLSIVAVMTLGVFLFLNGRIFSFVDWYSIRPFTLTERLMTQPRVVLFYLSQIVYPIATRFSVTHDVVTSVSLFSPWTTFPSILIVIAFVGYSIWRIADHPVLCFSVLFFFGNHLIESSVIPLEMIFEHRNYLPSLFLFFPVSLGIYKGIEYYRARKNPMVYFVSLSMCFVLMGIGISTYIRNTQWQSIRTLWEDAMNKAPQSARPLQTLAWGYYGESGQIRSAINLYERSLQLNFDRVYYKSISYNNLAGIYFTKLRDYEKAVEYAQKAVESYPDLTSANLMLCKSLGMLGQYDKAIERLNRLIETHPDHQNYLYLKGYILLKRSRPQEALDLFRKCLAASPDNWLFLREIGLCYNALQRYDKAFWFLRRADTLQPQKIEIFSPIVDNRLKAGKIGVAKKWARRLIDAVGEDQIDLYLRMQPKDNMSLPLDFGSIAMIVSEEFEDRSKDFVKKAVMLRSEYKER